MVAESRKCSQVVQKRGDAKGLSGMNMTPKTQLKKKKKNGPGTRHLKRQVMKVESCQAARPRD